MKKKVVKKRVVKRTPPRRINLIKKTSSTEKALIENFISLQKVMTNFSLKFDILTKQISNLLNLFEISAKSLAEKGSTTSSKEILEKIDELSQQNKIIARGLTLLHEPHAPIKIQNETSPHSTITSPQASQGYQKSIEITKPLPLKKPELRMPPKI